MKEKRWSIFFSRTWEEIYKDNKAAIAKDNLEICRTVSVFFAAVLIVFVAVAFAIRDTHLVPAYVVTAAVMIFIWYMARTMIKKNDYTTYNHRWLVYIFAASMYMFSAYIIHFGNANILSYVALVVILPVLIIDKPTQKFIMVLFSMALFFIVCVSSDWAPSLQEEYDINVNLFALVAYLCGVHNCWVKIQAHDLNRRLGKISSEDSGTGLLNRRRLFEDLKQLDEYGEIAGILMCDIDGFKKFNDTYGHSMGDKCIESVGKVLTYYGKEADIRFYRYGGDEFTGVLLKSSKVPIETAARDVAQMVNAVDIRVPSGDTVNISISVGFALLQAGVDYNECLKYADYKMYQVKQHLLMRRMAQNHLDMGSMMAKDHRSLGLDRDRKMWESLEIKEKEN